MEFDKYSVSLDYFIKIFFIFLSSHLYNVKRTAEKTHSCGMPVEMHHSPDNAPINRTICFLWHKTFMIQMTNFGLLFNLITFLDKCYGFMVLYYLLSLIYLIVCGCFFGVFGIYIIIKVMQIAVKIRPSSDLLGEYVRKNTMKQFLILTLLQLEPIAITLYAVALSIELQCHLALLEF